MKSRILYFSLFVLAAFIYTACTQTSENEQKAKRLAQETIIVDTHVDIPYRLKDEWEDISVATDGGDFDYPRAKEGGLNAPFMSIYIPARYQDTGGAKAAADSLIDMMEGIAADHPDKFAIAASPEEIETQFEEGLISLPMGIENGAAIEDDLDNLTHFFDRGIRYMTLTHSQDNLISDSSYDTTYVHNGISSFGEDVIHEMNRLGMMVDVSHISDSAFYDVMDISEAPVIASHSSCRHFTPGFERNMSDEMIEALAENGGTIMINFGSNFLEQESRESDSDNYHYSTVSKVADHIDHVVDLVGIDHVGIGSDYDGVGDTLPTGLKDVSTYPNLFKELLDRGYSEEDIEKISHGNIFRVWNEVAAIADSLQENS